MNDRVIEVQHKTVKVPHPSAETWSLQQVAELYALPFNDLLFRAQQVHREYFDANKVQLSTLLRCSTLRAPPRPTVPAASAWVPHGAGQNNAIWSR